MRGAAHTLALAVVALSLGHAGPAASQTAPHVLQRLNIGATGITCLRRPCPQRGVFRPGGGGLQARKRALLYADTDGRTGPPHLAASPDIVRAVNAAWSAMTCVQVLGRLVSMGSDRPALHIARLEGPCP